MVKKVVQRLNRIIKLCAGLALILFSLRTLFVVDLKVDRLIRSTNMIAFSNSDALEPDYEQAPFGILKETETKHTDLVSMRQTKEAEPVFIKSSATSNSSDKTSQHFIEKEPEDADPVSIHSNKSASSSRGTSNEEHASLTHAAKKGEDAPVNATDRQVAALYDDNLITMPDDNSRLDIPDLNGESFAACLLVMDENPRLNEWLAYHYYTLPLRYLVVAADPRSKTSADDILDKWRPFMNITTWQDDHYMEGLWLARAKKSMHPAFNDTIEATKIHRQRQVRFIASCSHHFKRTNRTWVAYHDTDEYIVLDSHMVNNTEALMREPGSILRFVKEQRARANGTTSFSKPCISLPRTTFGAIESTHEEMTKDVPPYVDAKQFNTLRFRHSASHTNKVNGPPKGIADVSLMPSKHSEFAVHRPLKDLCSSKWVQETFLNVHHYIGSWELYSYRQNDARADRRTKKTWESKAKHKQKMNNDDTRPWIKGFTDWEPAHKHLLQDTGPPPRLSSSQEEGE